MWPGKLFGLGFKSCWQLSFGFETRSNLQYFSRKHMTSYDIIWPCPSYFNLGLVDNKPEVVDRFRTWQFEGLLKRLHHERVHLRFGWLKDSGMKVTGVFGWFWMILDDFGWFWMILDDFGWFRMISDICCVDFANGSGFAHDAKFLCQELQLDLKDSWNFERWRQLWGKHSWKLKMRGFQKESPLSGVHFLRFHVNFQGCFVQYDPDGLHDEFAKYSVLKQDVWSGSHCNFGSCGSYHPQKWFGERDQSSSQSWMRYCARLQLALLQNVEDNLVRQQAELDLVNHPVLFQ